MHPQPAHAALSARYPAQVVVAPQGEWIATAPFGGVITRLPVAEGDQVHTKTVIAELRSPETPSLAAELAQAESAARLASVERDRDQQLLSEGIISARRAQASQDAAVRALSMREAMRQQLHVLDLSPAEAASGALRIRAPMNAIVIERMVTPGQRVNAADALIRLADPAQLLLELQVPASDAALQAGDILWLDDGSRATVIQSAWALQDQSQTRQVRARPTSSLSALVPGQIVSVQRSPAGTGTDPDPHRTAWILPRSAIARDDRADAPQPGPLVFVRTPQGFKPTAVTVLGNPPKSTIAPAESTTSVIVEGELSANDEIAMRGLIALKGVMLGHGGSE